MADGTHIEWTDATWNIINGCSVVSPGCTNCYAMRLAGTRLKHHPSRAGLTIDTKAGPVWNGVVRFHEPALREPLKWTRPRRIFVCAHGDLFHEAVPLEWRDQVFAVMALASHHTFQVLTKRPERARDYLKDACSWVRIGNLLESLKPSSLWNGNVYQAKRWINDGQLPNVWLGTSVEDQQRANERIPVLLATPAAVRWLSMEPLLGPIEWKEEYRQTARELTGSIRTSFAGIDWIVLGGESGPGARPMHPDWARSIRDVCAEDEVPFLFKQWGEFAPGEVAGEYLDPERAAEGLSLFDGRWDECWSEPDGHCDDEPDVYRVGKKRAGRLLDGVQHDGYPA